MSSHIVFTCLLIGWHKVPGDREITYEVASSEDAGSLGAVKEEAKNNADKTIHHLLITSCRNLKAN